VPKDDARGVHNTKIELGKPGAAVYYISVMTES